MCVPDRLTQVNAEVEEGKNPAETVRAFLGWFGAQRRGWRVVRDIRATLESLSLRTIPDFEYAYIDSRITFRRVTANAVSAEESSGAATVVLPATEQEGESLAAAAETPTPPPVSDPSYRIGKLPAANRKPVSVKPDTAITEAISVMLINDYSQLPVMTTDREVKGLFSWKSFASRTCLRDCGQTVASCMDSHVELSSETSIFEAVRVIAAAECVLIRDQTKMISGLVTTYDLALQFGQLGEPFLLLGEIENHVRNLMERKFSSEELAEARDPSDADRQITSVADLTFGEYIRLLENPRRWGQLGIAIDRAVFVRGLSEIRDIRNDVMHFDPDGVSEDDLGKLRNFAQFLERLQRLQAT